VTGSDVAKRAIGTVCIQALVFDLHLGMTQRIAEAALVVVDAARFLQVLHADHRGQIADIAGVSLAVRARVTCSWQPAQRNPREGGCRSRVLILDHLYGVTERAAAMPLTPEQQAEN